MSLGCKYIKWMSVGLVVLLVKTKKEQVDYNAGQLYICSSKHTHVTNRLCRRSFESVS